MVSIFPHYQLNLYLGDDMDPLQCLHGEASTVLDFLVHGDVAAPTEYGYCL